MLRAANTTKLTPWEVEKVRFASSKYPVVAYVVARRRKSLSPLSAAFWPQLVQLHDLLQKVFELDPSKRLTVEAALKHPFVSQQ